MEANKPINKVSEDTIWNGTAYGAMAGAAAAGAIHGGAAAGNAFTARQYRNLAADFAAADPNPNTLNNYNRKAVRMEERGNKYARTKGAFGGWKGAAIYGGSALVGGLSGGIYDNYN